MLLLYNRFGASSGRSAATYRRCPVSTLIIPRTRGGWRCLSIFSRQYPKFLRKTFREITHMAKPAFCCNFRNAFLKASQALALAHIGRFPDICCPYIIHIVIMNISFLYEIPTHDIIHSSQLPFDIVAKIFEQIRLPMSL